MNKKRNFHAAGAHEAPEAGNQRLYCEKVILDAADGACYLSVNSFSRILGQATQTTRNQLLNGRCPVPSVVLNGRRIWHVDDVIEFVCLLRGEHFSRRTESRGNYLSAIGSRAKPQDGTTQRKTPSPPHKVDQYASSPIKAARQTSVSNNPNTANAMGVHK